jgi:hypothetical protein
MEESFLLLRLEIPTGISQRIVFSGDRGDLGAARDHAY